MSGCGRLEQFDQHHVPAWCNNLHHLDLADASLPDEGALLAPFLVNLPALRILYLYNNQIHDSGMIAIAKYLPVLTVGKSDLQETNSVWRACAHSLRPFLFH